MPQACAIIDFGKESGHENKQEKVTGAADCCADCGVRFGGRRELLLFLSE
jgi:hypothetical protein